MLTTTGAFPSCEEEEERRERERREQYERERQREERERREREHAIPALRPEQPFERPPRPKQ